MVVAVLGADQWVDGPRAERAVGLLHPAVRLVLVLPDAVSPRELGSSLLQKRLNTFIRCCNWCRSS